MWLTGLKASTNSQETAGKTVCSPCSKTTMEIPVERSTDCKKKKDLFHPLYDLHDWLGVKNELVIYKAQQHQLLLPI